MRLIKIILIILITFICYGFIKMNNSDNRFPIFENQNFICNKNGKWGLIDKKNNTILPFKYDGIRAISDSIGIASEFMGSYSLNTGVPRYVYCGKYYLFSKDGIINKEGKEFKLVMVGVADFHNDKYTLSSPFNYIPKDTVDIVPCKTTDLLFRL